MSTPPASASPLQRLLIGAIRAYRLLLSPWLGSACRFAPTCSVYAIEAIEAHGALAGPTLALGRILRCHPWCAGGLDPVPVAPPRLFTSLPGLRKAAPPDPDRASP